MVNIYLVEGSILFIGQGSFSSQALIPTSRLGAQSS